MSLSDRKQASVDTSREKGAAPTPLPAQPFSSLCLPGSNGHPTRDHAISKPAFLSPDITHNEHNDRGKPSNSRHNQAHRCPPPPAHPRCPPSQQLKQTPTHQDPRKPARRRRVQRERPFCRSQNQRGIRFQKRFRNLCGRRFVRAPAGMDEGVGAARRGHPRVGGRGVPFLSPRRCLHHGTPEGPRQPQQELDAVDFAVVAGQVKGSRARGALLVGVGAVPEKEVGGGDLALGASFFPWECLFRGGGGLGDGMR